MNASAALEVLRAGALARAALERSGGIASTLPEIENGPFARAAGELLWVGTRLPAMHPRAVVTAHPRPAAKALHLAPLPATAWQADLPRVRDAAALIAAAERLRDALVAASGTRGFGGLLAGNAPAFPLGAGVAAVRALAAALARDEPPAAGAAARPLLGFGTGLTPSGDDLVGAALFARRLLAPGDARWAALGETLARETATRSHPVSAALFGDLVRGRSFAPLHAAAWALAANDDRAALRAASALVAIGHSSGWDMLTGFLLGIGIGFPG